MFNNNFDVINSNLLEQNSNNVSEQHSNFAHGRKMKKGHPSEFVFTANKSKLHGMGLFSKTPIKKDSKIMPIIKTGKEGYVAKITEPLNYINHSEDSNVKPVRRGDLIYIIAKRDINPNEEILIDYTDVANLGVKDPFWSVVDFDSDFYKAMYKIVSKQIPPKKRPEGYVFDKKQYIKFI